MRIYTPPAKNHVEPSRHGREQTLQNEIKHILETFDQLASGHVGYSLLSVTICNLFKESSFDVIRQRYSEIKDCTNQHYPQNSLQNFTATQELRKDIQKILNDINK